MVGMAATLALSMAEFVQPWALVTVTLYTPLMAGVAPGICGFCCEELNPIGPLHWKVALGEEMAYNPRVCVSQTVVEPIVKGGVGLIVIHWLVEWVQVLAAVTLRK